MSNEAKSEVQAPKPAKDTTPTERVAWLIAMAQPGKHLHAFWMNPCQDTLAMGVLSATKSMLAANQPDVAILAVLRKMSATNASALKQVLGDPKVVTLPHGAPTASPLVTQSLEAMGL